MRASRVIFEKGFELRRNKIGLWAFLPRCGAQLGISPSRITQQYGIRPILMAELHPSGKELITLFSPSGKKCADPFSLLEDIPHRAMILSFRGLRYVLGAAYYHCGQLAQKYSETWRTFHDSPLPSKAQSDIMNFIEQGFQEERYYEFDALVTSVIRCYLAMRFIIWHAFVVDEVQRTARPRRTFKDTLDACEGIPSLLRERLERSWSEFGEKAKAYRDFIQHYFPLDRGFAQARMKRLKGDVWSVVMLIPDNPEDKSPNRFEYNSQTDMLTYGWELTNEILEVAELTVREALDAQTRSGQMSQGHANPACR